jgi:uncharacterized protein involved in high-affinity Fe2+ transport
MKRIVALGALALATFGSLTSASADMMGNTVHQQRTAGAYQLTLQIGPAEAMSMHPKGGKGERMIGGSMASCATSGGGMDMSMGSTKCNHHIEVHVNNRKSSKVVMNARVTMRLTNQRTHAVITVPIMRMVGAKESMTHLHYGNNIHATAGAYTVTVAVNGTTVSFVIRLR